MSGLSGDPATLLHRSLQSGRIHSAYLLSGPSEPTRQAALEFVRGLVCAGDAPRRDAPTHLPCGACRNCRRSEQAETIAIDGSGKRGPLYRHVGDHPDLLWLERGDRDTRVRIGQIRAIQNALRLGSNEGGWRAVVIADAEWLNLEAQNSLLRLLEEPPPQTCLVLVAVSATGLLATIRSRCQRVVFPPLRAGTRSEEEKELEAHFESLAESTLPALLDWAEAYRGERAVAAERVNLLLAVGSAWLRQRVGEKMTAGEREVRAELDAFQTLSRCRRDLAQRNANPQLVAERALLAVQGAVQSGALRR